MKYFFVINPAAGIRNAEKTLRGALAVFNGKIDYEIYVIKGIRDAEDYLRDVRQRERGPLRFIACGGDGTLNIVVNAAKDMEDVAVGCYASGSGNDYIKYYGTVDDFLDLDKLFESRVEKVDLMSAGGRLAVNMVHFGFDTTVVQRMESMRRIPGIGGHRAYFMGVLGALLSPLSTACEVLVEGERFCGSRLLLCTLGCGKYVGGGYQCAPRSVNNDGEIEVCLVKPLSRLRLLKLMSLYRKGLHLDAPALKDLICYRRVKGAKISFARETGILLDGEIIMVKETDVSILPHRLNFLVPQGL